MKRFPVVASAAAIAALTGGCANIPSHGSVQLGPVINVGSQAGPAEIGQIGLIAALPKPGMTRAQVVRGFLRAETDNGATGVSRAYLTLGASAHWHPTSPTLVYDDGAVELRTPTKNQAVVRAPRIGSISAVGQWMPARSSVSQSFTLVRDSGQWRIGKLSGHNLLLGSSIVATLYQERQLAFLNTAGTVAVDLPFVSNVATPGLATALVRALLAGPPEPTAAVRTAIPPGTQLSDNVAIDGSGIADVDLTEASRDLKARRLHLVMDQLLLTLSQVPDVYAVAISVDGSPLTKNGHPFVEPMSASAALEPSTPGRRLAVVGSSGAVTGFAVPASAGQPSTLALQAGLPGRSWPPLDSLAWRIDGVNVAVVGRAGHESLVAGRADGSPHVVAHGAEFGTVQAAERDALVLDGDRVLDVRGETASPLHIPVGVEAAGVDAVALAPDGVRVALIVGAGHSERLVLGEITPGHRLVSIRDLPVTLDTAEGLAWTGEDVIATTSSGGERRSFVEVDDSGLDVHRSPLPQSVTTVSQLCAVPGIDPVVASRGRLLADQDGRWTQLASGVACSYSA